MSWLLFGAGAQGRITLEVLRALHPDAAVLFVDDAAERIGGTLAGVRVVSRIEAGERASAAGTRSLLAVGHNAARARLAAELGAAGWRFGVLVHPSAFVSPSATLGAGTVILPGALVQCGAALGEQVLVNTGAIVEHDCRVGDAASLSPGCAMGGRVTIGAGAFIGTGATLCPRVQIGARTMVGAGAVVTADLPADVVAFGVPARVVRPADPGRDWPRLL